MTFTALYAAYLARKEIKTLLDDPEPGSWDPDVLDELANEK